MATLDDIAKTYDWMDPFFRGMLGDNADITCAYFNGDVTKSLPQAQRDKHDMILAGTRYKPGMRILDVGCGWGPMIQAIRGRIEAAVGAGILSPDEAQSSQPVGITLSPAQARFCQAQGHDVRLMNYKDPAARRILGTFDGVVSVGALEHFCSPPEFERGEQDQVYRDFFEFCYDVLSPEGQLFVQTMLWGTRRPDLKKCTLKAPKGSDELIIARMMKFYPGSWLPDGKEQLVRDASEYFDFVDSSNGREDYIETGKRWSESTKNLLRPAQLHKTVLAAAALVPRLINRDVRTQLSSLMHHDQQVVFKNRLFDHERMFFQKRA